MKEEEKVIEKQTKEEENERWCHVLMAFLSVAVLATSIIDRCACFISREDEPWKMMIESTV